LRHQREEEEEEEEESTCMGEEEEEEEEDDDEPESALSNPEAELPPLLSVESIRRRPKLTRFIQLNPPPFYFRFIISQFY
jgi:hypothetical protein